MMGVKKIMLEDLILGLIAVLETQGNMPVVLLTAENEIGDLNGYLVVDDEITMVHRNKKGEIVDSSAFQPKDKLLMVF